MDAALTSYRRIVQRALDAEHAPAAIAG